MQQATLRVDMRNYKTSLCSNFESGYCELDDRCPLAHGEDELREPGEPDAEMEQHAGMNSRSDELPCMEFRQGFCRFGASCRFVHEGADEIDPNAGPPPDAGEMQEDDGVEKAEVCRDFVRIGRCKWGSECRFSHDTDTYLQHIAELEAAGITTTREEPLDSPPPPPLEQCAMGAARSISSELCRDFERGICKFGNACRFSHDMGPKPPPMVVPPRSAAGPEPLGDPQARARSLKHKTELCRHFARGHCQLGPDCSFAHGLHELRAPGGEPPPAPAAPPPPPSVPAGEVCRDFARGRCSFGADCRFAHVDLTAAAESSEPALPWSEPPPAKPKKDVCRHFARGYCQLGDDCRFSHVLSDEPVQPPAAHVPPVYAVLPPPAGPPGTVGGEEICRDYLRGRCKFGADCRFNHTIPPESTPYDAVGPEQLQTPLNKVPNKYKMVLCRHFERGYCELGMDCSFAHGPEELRSPEVRQPEPQTAAGRPRSGEQVEICVDYRRGVCKFGSACRFIHGTDGIGVTVSRMPLTVGQNDVGPLIVMPTAGSGSQAMGDICRDFARNRCNFGSECRFSHGPDHPTQWAGGRAAPPAPPNVIPVKYKLEMCRHYERGHCQLAELCGYAHGADELERGR